MIVGIIWRYSMRRCIIKEGLDTWYALHNSYYCVPDLLIQVLKPHIVMEVRQLIREIKQHLVTHDARIDTSASNLTYTENEAKAAHYRSVLYGPITVCECVTDAVYSINSTEIPSKGNYRKRLRVMSAARLQDPIDLERGNKVLLPPSVLQFLCKCTLPY
jgi:hypothetical protein